MLIEVTGRPCLPIKQIQRITVAPPPQAVMTYPQLVLIFCIGVLTENNRYTTLYSRSSVDTNTNKEKHVSVADFYAGKSVFLTGGTGFLGKVIIEKLLHSCPRLDKLYVLIREKNNKNIENRMDDIIKNPLFDRLREKRPENLKKIVPVNGDITFSQLGINSKDEQVLLDKVSIVIHSAATVKFNETLKTALDINLEGTKRILDLSRRIKNLQAFVHVSTSFCNTDKRVLHEMVYPPPIELHELDKFVEEHGNDNEYEIKKLLNGKPNTYSFAKALAETYVQENHGDVPTVIVRPAIVAPTNNEPVGWSDNWYGATGFMTFIGTGLLRAIPGNGKYSIDMIPVDYVSNLSIVAATRCKVSEKVPVYNCCTSAVNPILWDDFERIFRQECVRQRLNVMPYPGAVFTSSDLILKIISLIAETTPAFIRDLILRIEGKEPRYLKMQSRVNYVRENLYHFTANTWVMHADRVRELASSLPSAEKEQFPFDPVDINWNTFIKNYSRGVKRYLLKNKNIV